MDSSGTTLVGLALLAFFALLLIGGLVLVGALGVYAYKTFRQGDQEPGTAKQGWLAAVLLGALLSFLGALGMAALLTFALLSTITGAAGVMRTIEEEPEPPAPTVVVREREPEPARTRLVAEVKGSLDPALVQKLSDIATRRRELDLRVRTRQSDKGETSVYEFVLPPVELDPADLQREMRRELEKSGLVPVSLTSEKGAE
jgi:hypothetical protein